MSRNTAWTDNEIGHLQDLRHLTALEAARVLGRTRKQVLHMRQRLEKGWTRVLEPVTEGELDFVAMYPDFTAEQIGRHLGRSTASVNAMRRMLRQRGDVTSRNIDKNPWHRGARSLVAQSCCNCGLLLDASWFTSRGKARSGHRSTRCRKCSAQQVKRANKVNRYSQRYAAKLQAASLSWADRRGQEWTGAELEVLSDDSLTNLQKSIDLRRSYFGVTAAAVRLGVSGDRKPEVPDPTNAQWFIHLSDGIKRAVSAAMSEAE